MQLLYDVTLSFINGLCEYLIAVFFTSLILLSHTYLIFYILASQLI